MNKLDTIHALPTPETSLVLDALRVLREKFSIEGQLVDLEPAASSAFTPDASIDLMTVQGVHRYLVACKSSIDRKAQIDQVRRLLETTGVPALLVATHITRELADHCRSIGLQFIDASGNAYLQAPGLLVFVSGEKKVGGQLGARAPKGLTKASALRVIFALLVKPALINSTLQDIAGHAGVSLGTTYNALGDLERRGYLINKKDVKRRKLLERSRLMDEWAMNYPTTLRTKLHGRRFSAPDPSWWQSDDLEQLPLTWGSEVAAMKMTGHLKPATQTLYVQPPDMSNVLKFLVKQHRLRPDPEGDIEILERFWQWNADAQPHLAPPLLVWSELNALLDPRAQETAHMLKEQYFDATFDQGRSPG